MGAGGEGDHGAGLGDHRSDRGRRDSGRVGARREDPSGRLHSARLGDMDRVKAGMRAARTVPFAMATHLRPRCALMALVLILSIGTMSFLRFGSSTWPLDVVELDDDMVAPVAVSQTRPDYTPGAMRAKVQGVIRLRCVVSLDGECTDVTVVRSLDPQFGLDTAAVRALREWRFQPGRRDGRPVATRIELEFAFSLR